MEFQAAELQGFANLAVKYGMELLYAVVIAVVGFWLASFLSGRIYAAIKANKRIDDTLAGFTSSFVKYSIITIVVIAVLQMFGIQTTSLIAVLGAASLAIGLALQSTLASFAAGIMLLIFRPFRVGQNIQVAGFTGTVNDITIFTTELRTADNVQIIVPNKDIWGAAVTNYSATPDRRLDLDFKISDESDIDRAVAAAHQAIKTEPRVLSAPVAPFVAVTAVDDGFMTLTLRVWCRNAEYEGVKISLLKQVLRELAAAGIQAPDKRLQLVQLYGAQQTADGHNRPPA